jgi:DNA polymerase elongation subunit (family B)
MKEYLIDVFRNNGKIVLWKKNGTNNFFEEYIFRASFYCEYKWQSLNIIKRLGLNFYSSYKNNFLGNKKKVYHVFVENIDYYEQYINSFEKMSNYKIALYNADITPEQQFMFTKQLNPFSRIDEIDLSDDDPPLTVLKIELDSYGDVQTSFENKIKKIIMNEKIIEGEEIDLLLNFKEEFFKEDPDIISMHRAYLYFPYLMHRFKINNIEFELNRIGNYDNKYKEGKPWSSYGLVVFKDRPVRLKGRLLLDTNTSIGRSCDISGIVELCRLSGARFQNICSRSFGFVFQQKIVRTLIEEDMLVLHKEKPVDRPMTFYNFLKSDRYGHRFDPKPGFYNNIIEVDFASMYPWIIYQYNISADTLISQNAPLRKIPGLELTVSDEKKGIIPKSIKSFLDKRMECKKNPSTINNKRSDALKAVLVSSYGYLRFREFKLGLGSAHMAIGAYSRNLLLDTAILAEKYGYKVINGVVDSLYLQFDNYSDEKIKDFLLESSEKTKVPIELKSVYKWIIILSSISDRRRKVCTRYFGLTTKGEFKIRGLTLRRKGYPVFLRFFQQSLIEKLRDVENEDELYEKIPLIIKNLREGVMNIDSVKKEHLIFRIVLGKTEYDNNVAQKQILEYYKKKGIKIYPGQEISFIKTKKGAVVPEEYDNNLDYEYYSKLLINITYEILQPFGITKKYLEESVQKDRQAKLAEFENEIKLKKLSPHMSSFRNHTGNVFKIS